MIKDDYKNFLSAVEVIVNQTIGNHKELQKKNEDTITNINRLKKQLRYKIERLLMEYFPNN